MKVYFVLLSVLYLATVAMSVLTLANYTHWAFALRSVADIVLLALGLWGCYGLAFGRRYLSPPAWRIIYNAILMLGVATVAIVGFGHRIGVPSPAGDPSLLHVAMIFLPYLLFSIPAIVYQHTLAKIDEQ